jgi:hypothetical protein
LRADALQRGFVLGAGISWEMLWLTMVAVYVLNAARHGDVNLEHCCGFIPCP